MKMTRKLLAALLIAILCVSSIALPAFAATKYKATATVNIRSGPGTSYKKIGSIGKGNSATYQDEKKKDSKGVYWYRIKYGSTSGWVCSKYLKKSSSSSSSSTKVKTTGDVYLRSGAAKSFKILKTIPKGTTVTYLGEKHKDSRGVTWYRVKYDGKTGWVSSKYSKLV